MAELHNLLKRQLKRYTGDQNHSSVGNAELLQAIDQAYRQFDEDRIMLEHSLELTSQELLEKNAELRRINSALEQRVDERTSSLQRQNEMLGRLYQITLDLLKYMDINQLLGALINLASDFLDAPYAEIMLMEGEELVVRSATANQVHLIGGLVKRDQDRLSWRAFDTREPVVMADYATWPDRREVYAALGIHAIAEIPILTADACLGILSFGRDQPGYVFLPDQIQHGMLLANVNALILQNAQMREYLKDQSVRDPLTGLFNRRYMEETLKREVSRVTRQLHPLGIIMLDIDHFKKFNDQHGHLVGDVLLHEVGLFLQKHVRSEDVACRYGGEEFILILPDITLNVGMERAEMIRLAILDLNLLDNGHSYGGITFSLGVAIYPQHGKTIEAVIRAADAALYHAKQAGRNQVMAAQELH